VQTPLAQSTPGAISQKGEPVERCVFRGLMVLAAFGDRRFEVQKFRAQALLHALPAPVPKDKREARCGMKTA
jgi:hypothetical protein